LFSLNLRALIDICIHFTLLWYMGASKHGVIWDKRFKFMKLLILFFGILGLQCTNASPYVSIKDDLDSGLLPVEAVKNAHKNKELSQDVVQQLVDNNVDVIKAVQTVANEWSSCEDTYSSVRKGVQIAPSRADEVVAAIATMRGCSCNAQSFWARSRLENRLRPRIQRALVEISSSCSCASAGIEAAIEIVPNKAEDMIDAVLRAKNRADTTADSIGQIGKLPENKYWGENEIITKDNNLVRNVNTCKGDHNEQDAFDPAITWINSNDENTSEAFNYNKVLGQHKLICDDENNDETNKEEQKETKEEENNKLIISQYIEGQGNNQALELFNGTDEPIDLLTDNYQIEVYFHGYDFPGEIIQLKGLIEPKSTYIVADANAAADILSSTNQKVTGLVFKGADAVVLKSGLNSKPCQCAVSTVAAAINNVDGKSNEKEMSETKKDFIQRIEQHYQNTNTQTTVIDSIGRILVNDEESESNEALDHPIIVDKTLRRFDSTCSGDRIEMDEFVSDKQWTTHPVDDIQDSGNFSKQDCFATRKDLLITEYVEGTDNNASIELFNGTSRSVDFDKEKYILEIYNDDDANPEQEIYLTGQINANGVFVISNNEAEEELKLKSNQLASGLLLANTRAVVLKKVVLPAYQSCYADIANWLTKSPNKNITYTLSPILDPGGGPQTDDDPRDGDDGGELASPN
jgi:hypothetical protein